MAEILHLVELTKDDAAQKVLDMHAKFEQTSRHILQRTRDLSLGPGPAGRSSRASRSPRRTPRDTSLTVATVTTGKQTRFGASPRWSGRQPGGTARARQATKFVAGGRSVSGSESDGGPRGSKHAHIGHTPRRTTQDTHFRKRAPTKYAWSGAGKQGAATGPATAPSESDVSIKVEPEELVSGQKSLRFEHGVQYKPPTPSPDAAVAVAAVRTGRSPGQRPRAGKARSASRPKATAAANSATPGATEGGKKTSGAGAATPASGKPRKLQPSPGPARKAPGRSPGPAGGGKRPGGGGGQRGACVCDCSPGYCRCASQCDPRCVTVKSNKTTALRHGTIPAQPAPRAAPSRVDEDESFVTAATATRPGLPSCCRRGRSSVFTAAPAAWCQQQQQPTCACEPPPAPVAQDCAPPQTSASPRARPASRPRGAGARGASGGRQARPKPPQQQRQRQRSPKQRTPRKAPRETTESCRCDLGDVPTAVLLQPQPSLSRGLDGHGPRPRGAGLCHSTPKPGRSARSVSVTQDCGCTPRPAPAVPSPDRAGDCICDDPTPSPPQPPPAECCCDPPPPRDLCCTCDKPRGHTCCSCERPVPGLSCACPLPPSCCPSAAATPCPASEPPRSQRSRRSPHSQRSPRRSRSPRSPRGGRRSKRPIRACDCQQTYRLGDSDSGCGVCDCAPCEPSDPCDPLHAINAGSPLKTHHGQFTSGRCARCGLTELACRCPHTEYTFPHTWRRHPKYAGACDAEACDAGPCDAGPCDTGACDAGPCDTRPCDTEPCDPGACDAVPCEARRCDPAPARRVTLPRAPVH